MAQKASINGRARGKRTEAESLPAPQVGSLQFGRRAKSRRGKLQSRPLAMKRAMRGSGIARAAMDTELSRQERNRQIEEEAD